MAAELSDEQKRQFVEDGYLILREAVTQSAVAAALSHADRIYEERGRPRNGGFYEPDRRHESIASLFEASPLRSVAESLLGHGNVKLLSLAQIAYTPCQTSAVCDGIRLNDRHPSHKWHVDASHGKFAPLGADFLLLFGIALSDGQYIDENRGQLIIFPGSHLATHKRLREIVRTTSPSEVMLKFRSTKPSVGPSVRVLLRPGDAIVAHQRLAHCPGFNLCDIVRKNVYFRVTHPRFAEIVESYVSSLKPWIGFDGLTHILGEDITKPGLLASYNSNDGDNVCLDSGSKTEVPSGISAEMWHMRRLLAAYPLGGDAPRIGVEEARVFLRDGFVVLRGVVSQNLLTSANERITAALHDNRVSRNVKRFYAGSSEGTFQLKRPDLIARPLMALMLSSGLVDIAEGFVGTRNVVIGDGISDAILVPPSDEFIAAGRSATEPHCSQSWTVDVGKARFKDRGLDHLIRVGVALSGGLDIDENRGQLVVWPGSHLKTHDMIRNLVENNDSGPFKRPYWQARKKLNCGEPKRLLLQPGDVFVLHQRLATAIGANMTQTIARMVQFKVEIVSMEQILDDFNKSETPFKEFEGLQQFLPINDI